MLPRRYPSGVIREQWGTAANLDSRSALASGVGTLAEASAFEGDRMLNASPFVRSAGAEMLLAKTLAGVCAEHSRDGSGSSMNTQLLENIFEMGTHGGD